jgi:hypothetical protein
MCDESVKSPPIARAEPRADLIVDRTLRDR